METEETKKAKPCPACKADLVLQYTKEEPGIRQDPVTDNLRVPMRCSKCGINLEVTITPKELEDDQRD